MPIDDNDGLEWVAGQALISGEIDQAEHDAIVAKIKERRNSKTEFSLPDEATEEADLISKEKYERVRSDVPIAPQIKMPNGPKTVEFGLGGHLNAGLEGMANAPGFSKGDVRKGLNKVLGALTFGRVQENSPTPMPWEHAIRGLINIPSGAARMIGGLGTFARDATNEVLGEAFVSPESDPVAAGPKMAGTRFDPGISNQGSFSDRTLKATGAALDKGLEFGKGFVEGPIDYTRKLYDRYQAGGLAGVADEVAEDPVAGWMNTVGAAEFGAGITKSGLAKGRALSRKAGLPDIPVPRIPLSPEARALKRSQSLVSPEGPGTAAPENPGYMYVADPTGEITFSRAKANYPGIRNPGRQFTAPQVSRPNASPPEGTFKVTPGTELSPSVDPNIDTPAYLRKGAATQGQPGPYYGAEWGNAADPNIETPAYMRRGVQLSPGSEPYPTQQSLTPPTVEGVRLPPQQSAVPPSRYAPLVPDNGRMMPGLQPPVPYMSDQYLNPQTFEAPYKQPAFNPPKPPLDPSQTYDPSLSYLEAIRASQELDKGPLPNSMGQRPRLLTPIAPNPVGTKLRDIVENQQMGELQGAMRDMAIQKRGAPSSENKPAENILPRPVEKNNVYKVEPSVEPQEAPEVDREYKPPPTMSMREAAELQTKPKALPKPKSQPIEHIDLTKWTDEQVQNRYVEVTEALGKLENAKNRDGLLKARDRLKKEIDRRSAKPTSTSLDQDKIDTAQRMARNGWKTKDIVEETGLPKEEVERITSSFQEAPAGPGQEVQFPNDLTPDQSIKFLDKPKKKPLQLPKQKPSPEKMNQENQVLLQELFGEEREIKFGKPKNRKKSKLPQSTKTKKKRK